MTKILLTWKNGMLGSDCYKIFSKKYDVIACSHEELNISDSKNLEKFFSENHIDIVINCAAYTDVNNAEHPHSLNYETNTYGVYLLGKMAKKYHLDLIHISTDYVFDGQKIYPYTESDIPNPINHYGKAKYLWEKLLLQELEESIIIRTSWLYGGEQYHKNFVHTMQMLATKNHEIRVVNTQFWVPTYTIDLVLAIEQVIKKREDFRGKILHFSNFSEKGVSWYDFAKKIFEILWKDITIIPISDENLPSLVKRPKNSHLQNSSSIILPNWETSLEAYLQKYKD